jgi:lipoate synthase
VSPSRLPRHCIRPAPRTPRADALQRASGVDSVTIGQYLRPSLAHLPVVRYWEPSELDALADEARALGFAQVASGPLVCSSFSAVRAFEELRVGRA